MEVKLLQTMTSFLEQRLNQELKNRPFCIILLHVGEFFNINLFILPRKMVQMNRFAGQK